jgi:hypothetical protein
MNNKIYNLIIMLFLGFMIIYIIHPEPKILYKKNYLRNCKLSNKNICIEE